MKVEKIFALLSNALCFKHAFVSSNLPADPSIFEMSIPSSGIKIDPFAGTVNVPVAEFQKRLDAICDMKIRLAELNYIATHPSHTPVLGSIPTEERGRIVAGIKQEEEKKWKDSTTITIEADGTVTMKEHIWMDITMTFIELRREHDDRFSLVMGGIMVAGNILARAERNHCHYDHPKPRTLEGLKRAIEARAKERREVFEKHMPLEDEGRQRIARRYFEYILEYAQNNDKCDLTPKEYEAIITPFPTVPFIP